jgi:RNA polymerase sigma factor (sigma-70 family)
MKAHRLTSPDLLRLFDAGSITSLSEWQLLERFVLHRDQQAFEALVARHGPMVLGTCRRVLGNSQDVDDAFQATFLVLLKRAGSLGPGDVLAGWLHGVAVRVAHQARSTAFRRGQRERTGLALESASPEPAGHDPELQQILDEEISRLPWKYRAPIVLCYLQGHTHEQAARQLEWPLGTVKGRLSRARAQLEGRLSRRGLALGGALAALAAGTRAEAAVAQPLIEATCRAVQQLASGKLSVHIFSTSIARLAEGVLTAMIIQKLRLIALSTIVSGLLLTGSGVLARQQAGRDGTTAETPQEKLGAAKQQVASVELPSPDASSRPPVAATVRKSEADLVRDVLQAARHAYLATRDDYHKGHSHVERVYQASRLLMNAESETAATAAQKAKAVEAHLERMRDLARSEEHAADGDPNGSEAHAFLAEAQLLLAQAKAHRPAPPAAGAPVQGSKSGPGEDPKSQAINAKLEEPIPMNFANETPLEDVLKYIKQATTHGPTDSGIPIYVDPIGLQEAEKTMASTVQLDLEGVPLRRTLQLALKQLDLIYFVDDGTLVITSQDSEDHKLPPSQAEPAPFVQKSDKFDRGEMSLDEMKTFVEELKMRKEVAKLKQELEKIENAPKGGGIQ